MRSIKTKLVLAVASLVVLILVLAAVFLIRDKEQELNQDLFDQTLSFTQLTAKDAVDFYQLYLAQNSFVYFNREVSGLFQKNKNISELKIYKFGGELLYDSVSEREQQYQGDVRSAGPEVLERVKSQFISVELLDGQRVVYLSFDANGEMKFVDVNGLEVSGLDGGSRIGSFVLPVENAYAVEYGISYADLDARILAMRNNIMMLALAGILLGIGMSWVLAVRITRPIKKVTAGAQKIAVGDFQTRIQVDTKDETQVLAKTFNQMAQTLEITTKAMLYEERVRKELELAAQIQKDILPKRIPKVTGLDLSAGLIPAEEIGGDCYDFISLGGGKWIFYVGDVTGHGVPSGIVVSIANAMFFASSEGSDPKDILIKVNRVLKEKTTASMFLTLLLLYWDEVNGSMQYLSAGHEPILVYRAKEKKVEMLKHGGIALGMLPDISPHLEGVDVQLKIGDFMVVYTDGIPEAWRSEKEMYGMDRLKAITAAAGDFERASAIRNAILADVKEFTGEYKQMDDITVMVVKRGESGNIEIDN